MRSIEWDMIRALKNHEGFTQDNTAVLWDGDNYLVAVFGNTIAAGKFEGYGVNPTPTRFTLAGYNTSTTRSRLNALGIRVEQKKGIPYYNGKEISETDWIPVEA